MAIQTGLLGVYVASTETMLIIWWHGSCPVSGCECCCQFDGIHKLSRRTSSGKGSMVDGDVDESL
eukprot:scaffold167_cov110-Cylindrotheca_fusiformis.AAC.23